MTPILYVSLLAGMLLLIIYISLTTLADRSPNRHFKVPGHMFQFESAQELFKYVESEDIYLPHDSIKLVRNDYHRVTAYWHLSREKWEEYQNLSRETFRQEQIFLRIYEAREFLRTRDIPVRSTIGSYDFELPSKTFCYGSLGIKEGERFLPLLCSNLVGRPG